MQRYEKYRNKTGILSSVSGLSRAIAQIGRQIHFALSKCIHKKQFKKTPDFLRNAPQKQFGLRIARYFYRFSIAACQLRHETHLHFDSLQEGLFTRLSISSGAQPPKPQRHPPEIRILALACLWVLKLIPISAILPNWRL